MLLLSKSNEYQLLTWDSRELTGTLA